MQGGREELDWLEMLVCLVTLVCLVYLVYLVCLVWRVRIVAISLMQSSRIMDHFVKSLIWTDPTYRIDKIDQTDLLFFLLTRT